MDGDGFVTILDALAMLQSFGLRTSDVGFDHRADVNGDGQVDVADLLVLATNFGRTR